VHPCILAGLAAFGLFCPVGPASAQKAAGEAKELVAVLELDALGASKNQVSAVSERLREELLATGRYRLVDRGQLEKVMEEQALQQTGCTTQECAVQVGRILGVRKLVTGKVNRVEAGLWLLSSSLIDVESAEIIRAASVQPQGDFKSLLADGAPQLVGRLLEGGGARPGAARAPRLAEAALQVTEVPPHAKVFLNGVEKGNGPQQFTQLAPGQYEVVVRLPGYRPFKQAVTLAAGQAARVQTQLEVLRLAFFPIFRTGTWSSPEAQTTGWTGRAVKAAVEGSGLVLTHAVHSEDPRESFKHGRDLRRDPETSKNAWSFFGNPEVEFAMHKGRQLDVDAVLLLRLTTGVSGETGSWKAYLVETAGGGVLDDSGLWPYKGSSKALTAALKPLLARFAATPPR
jgi:hypothetical protein